MNTYLLFAALLGFIAYLRYARPPSQPLYRCTREGKNSALYVKRTRDFEHWGSFGPVDFPIGFTVVEYRRITCAPGQSYTAATSGWFTPTWSERDKAFFDSYVVMSREAGITTWKSQIKPTLKVAFLLFGPRAPNHSCVAV